MKKLVILLLFAYAGASAQDVLKFTAKIDNRNSDSIYIASRTFRKVIHIKNGIFSDSFAVEKGFYQMGDGTEVTSLFLANGDDLNLKMDAKMFDETIVYTGKGAKENNFLAALALENERLGGLMDKGDQAALQKAIAESAAKELEKLKDPELDPLFTKAVGGSIQQQSQQMATMMAQKQAAQKMEGNASPLFDYENHKGGKTKLADLKGKYVYIDTWATWCGPCRGEIPFLQKVEEKYKGKNIEFVSISIDTAKDHDKWKKFVDDKQLGGTQLIADADWSSQFCKDFGINSIPRFILIGPDGKVISADAERPSSPQLEQRLDQLLK
jgi:thiol-disulfide isomerase/thioredoxin